MDRLQERPQRKLLAIDGGGIRGVLSLGILASIENHLRLASGRPELVLADYFDYISGTSTGGIIAAALSVGKTVAEVLDFYITCGADIFKRAPWLHHIWHRYDQEALAEKLQEVFGQGTLLNSNRIRTLLMLVMRNATTDSPWPITNNPAAKYNDRKRVDCNLHFPLWQLVRASTAAPTYFRPEVIEVGDKRFVFMDGGITPYNNPAFQMFLMATSEYYWPRADQLGLRPWTCGEDRMLIVSVGTGSAPGANAQLKVKDMNMLFNGLKVPPALMYAAQVEQDMLCRTFGKCLHGAPLDREIGPMIGSHGPLGEGKKLFTYVRYDASLTREGLDGLGFDSIDPKQVQKLDAVGAIDLLRQIGSQAGREVSPRHLEKFPV